MAQRETKPPNSAKKRQSGSSLVITFILCAVVLFFVGFTISTELFPPFYLAFGTILFLLLVGCVRVLTRNPEHRVKQFLGFALAGALILGCAVSSLALWQTVRMMRQVTNTSAELAVASFYVELDSAAQTLNDINGHNVGILAELDRANTDEILRQTEAESQLTFSLKEYDTLTDLADALLEKQVDSILLNQAFVSLYAEISGYEDFSSGLRELSTQAVDHAVQNDNLIQAETEETIEDPVITVLISGSDTRGTTIDRRGRSDVNIIVRINRETHKILMISTPRDYYVPLALSSGTPYDKLTHAGIYGMDVLMGTLENLYHTEIDYYFRINFTGFVEIIDALGGIEVYSDYAFTVGNYEYQQGVNFLNGDAALAFARERYSFAEGDRQRGENQMAVIEGVLEKALSPSILSGYSAILESIQDCVDTSVPYELIAELVRQQLADNASWSVESFSVDGTGSSAATYSMSQRLYVMLPDEATVQEASDKLAALADLSA